MDPQFGSIKNADLIKDLLESNKTNFFKGEKK